jgi:hypothetical protein
MTLDRLLDGLYILGFIGVVAAIVGISFKAFEINNEKINKLFHLED